ncbi:Putative cytochrome P450 [Septoria linicola]|uniref:Cytochrome P450 n=1 Tax=Septoria linicola TaxID=215465 RepID=A0A9Q9AZW6_9PEZI|nr:Putative cytochrome P450 [Septoria linicola]
MATNKSFHFDGSQDQRLAFDVDISNISDLAGLRQVIGSSCAVVKPEGLSFHCDDDLLEDVSDVEAAAGSIAIKVDGYPVRTVPGPAGLPLVGNYFEVYPDHLGNNQRLFEKFGPIFKTSSMGQTVCQTNDPELADICFAESDFFSKENTPEHPLYPIKQQMAGVFLADTSHPSWKVVHKFLPPALGPKAVRHYAIAMNECCKESYPVFDELEAKNEAWNVYQFMLKLSSGTIGKIMLGQDFEHFSSVDAPLHMMVLAMAEVLSINKKISSRGEWYSHLPFGDPARLKNLQKYMAEFIEQSIRDAKSSGTEDLPLQDAALRASNVIDQIDELPMLGKFIKEMQRRHNPSYQPGRTAQQDLILPGGYQVKKGTVVICAIHHISNNPKIWDNPNNFDPDRCCTPSKMCTSAPV